MLLPGVAFARNGARCGHGMGYYDKYLKESFDANPHRFDGQLRGKIDEKLAAKKTILLGLALQEQVLPEAEVPLDEHDYLLDDIVTSD